jgi:hypothetical protein
MPPHFSGRTHRSLRQTDITRTSPTICEYSQRSPKRFRSVA